METRKMFNVDDPANAEIKTTEEKETKVATEETVKEAGLFKGFTPKQVLKMKEDLNNEYQQKLAKATEEAKKQGVEQYKKQLLEEQELKEKQEVFNKIESDETIKKQFENYGINYKTIDKANLSIYMKIFEGKKNENTANPKGEKIVDSDSNIDVDKIIAEQFKEMGV